MEDRGQEVLKKYQLKVYNVHRARGAFLLETDCGLKLYKPFEGSRNKALFEHKVKEHLYQHGYQTTDLFVKTMDDNIIAEDSAKNQYIMKNWYWGEECNLRELSEIEEASMNLARLHLGLQGVDIPEELLEHNICDDLSELFQKRNRELKRVRGYIRDKKQKNEFELCYINYYSTFYQQGLEAEELLNKSEYHTIYRKSIEERQVCHGNYTYHNILMLKSRAEGIGRGNSHNIMNRELLSAAELSEGYGSVAVTNFEKAQVGLQIADLYQFMRKVMEKNDWDILYGNNMIEAYDQVKPITKEELNVLYLLLLYPEKFWKITNYYYNGKKSWISGRNIQKLNNIGEQNKKKEMFLEKLKDIL